MAGFPTGNCVIFRLLSLLILCVIGFLTPPTLAFDNDCSIDPISLPWTNISLDGVALNRGIAVQIGDQTLGLRATTIFNNTRVRNRRDCELGNASTYSGCEGASGSGFDPLNSPNWTPAPEGNWNVTSLDPHDANEIVYDGWDTVKFFGLDMIPGFPIEVWSNIQSDNKSGLALGTSSSFLDTLLASKLIPSVNWGLFFGSRSQTRGMDGNLTLGGYDKARVANGWTSHPIAAGLLPSPCPLQVEVADIVLNNVDGSFSLFADPDSTVAFCIDALQNQFSLTPEMYALFASVTHHVTDPGDGSSNYTQQTYPLDAEPLLGNLSITLSNGYVVNIPHYELVSQERGTDLEGKYSVINESRVMVAVGTTADSEATPVLGGVFLSQVYLFVNASDGMFYLADAVTEDVGDQDHDIVQVCVSAVGNVSGRSNVGAIAGGVVGGVAGLTAIILALAWFRHRIMPEPRNLSQNEGNAAVSTLEVDRLHAMNPQWDPHLGVNRDNQELDTNEPLTMHPQIQRLSESEVYVQHPSATNSQVYHTPTSNPADPSELPSPFNEPDGGFHLR